MPELPEVETCVRALTPYLHRQTVSKVILRTHQLRWPIPQAITHELPGQIIESITRRGKYLLFQTPKKLMMIHLGMSGHLRLLFKPIPAQIHDHVDIQFNHTIWLRYTDPRRFGAILWTEQKPSEHHLLRHLGPEPLSDAFDAAYLYQRCRNRKVSVKLFIMRSDIVAGIGNIYANEALFQARIKPTLAANALSKQACVQLCSAIKIILKEAIQQGGTSLKDFVKIDGKPGYFKQHLKVYGQAGKPCTNCHTPLKQIKLAQRTTVYCPSCQP